MCKSNLKNSILIIVETNKALCEAIDLSKIPSTLNSSLKVEFVTLREASISLTSALSTKQIKCLPCSVLEHYIMYFYSKTKHAEYRNTLSEDFN